MLFPLDGGQVCSCSQKISPRVGNGRCSGSAVLGVQVRAQRQGTDRDVLKSRAVMVPALV